VLVIASEREACARCIKKIEEIRADIQSHTTLPTNAIYLSSKNLKNQTGQQDLGDYDEDEVLSLSLSSSPKNCMHLQKYTEGSLSRGGRYTFCQSFWTFVENYGPGFSKREASMSNESLSFSKAEILGQTRQISQVFAKSVLIDKHWFSSKFFNERCSCAVELDLFLLSLPWKEHVIFDIQHKLV
jgi:hypothetical protein